MSRFIRLFCVLFMAGVFSTGYGRRHVPYDGSRIYWDITTKKMLFQGGNYSRIIGLADGRLMAVAESGGGISVSYSDDCGDSWTSPRLIAPNAPMVPYAVPDVIQLKNGDIVVGFNPRPSVPYSEDRRFCIRCVRSTDNGATWTEPIYIYDARHEYTEGCWEPCFLELPSGELQCYFANENNFPYSGEQEISMCRSFDGGKTWSEETRICFSNGSRDGMPVPILTENGEIVVIIEDNGWSGYNGFRATTVRTSLEDNWSEWVPRSTSARQMVFYNNDDKQYISAAPYIRKLGTSETIVSWQGDRGDRKGVGEDRFEMSVGVGDADGRNVKAISSPFTLPMTQHGLWNSVSTLDDGTVFTLTSIGNVGEGNSIYMMRGYARKGFEAAFGTPVIDGTANKETWTAENARQVFMGSNASGKSAVMDFLYDNDNLYFYATVNEALSSGKINDATGVTLALDVAGCCDSYPQEGIYSFYMDVTGAVKFKKGRNNKWFESETPETISYVCDVKRNSYSMEIAIPWDVLDTDKPPYDNAMRCCIEIHHGSGNTGVIESIPDCNIEQSWTWPEFWLKSNENEGVHDLVSENAKNHTTIQSVGDIIYVSSAYNISRLSLYVMSGKRIYNCSGVSKDMTVSLPGLKGIFLVDVICENGDHTTAKIVLK